MLISEGLIGAAKILTATSLSFNTTFKAVSYSVKIGSAFANSIFFVGGSTGGISFKLLGSHSGGSIGTIGARY
jgi:hypothetical protein